MGTLNTRSSLPNNGGSLAKRHLSLALIQDATPFPWHQSKGSEREKSGYWCSFSYLSDHPPFPGVGEEEDVATSFFFLVDALVQ